MTTRCLATAGLLSLLFVSGCSSISTNAALLTDQSHLGTPYSGTRADAHVLYCFGRGVSRDATTLILTPFALLFLIDLPLSIAFDTLLLPIDIPMEPEAAPSVPGRGGCKLIGM